MIDKIIDEIEGLPNKEAATKFSERFVKTQQQLVEFLFVTLEECSSEAQETGFFIALVAWSYYSRINKAATVSEKAIIQKFEQANEEMQAYEDGDESAIARILPDEIEDEEVLSFLTTEIEAARQDGEITMDEAGTLYVSLKVIVDCLAEAGEKQAVENQTKQ